MGCNVATPTIRTTNDMPVHISVHMPSLGLFPVQINPLYLMPPLVDIWAKLGMSVLSLCDEPRRDSGCHSVKVVLYIQVKSYVITALKMKALKFSTWKTFQNI